MGLSGLPEATGTWLWRGFPPGIEGLPLESVAAQGWTSADLVTPVATLSQSALSHNQRALDRWADGRDALLAPHVKTTMSPDLLRLQLDSGVWAVTAANPWQAAVMVASGASRVMIANEVADARALARVLRGADVWVFVDSPAAVAVAAEAARLAGTEVPVVLEVGFPGGRAGVRTLEAALRTAAACRDSEGTATGPGVRLAGYGLFEGILAAGRTAADVATVRAGLERAARLVEQVAAQHPVPDPVLTGGGSMFSDLVADVLGGVARRLRGRLVLRPGCYLVHDHGAYAQSYRDEPWLDLRPALTLWTTVLSVPEPGLALLDAGKRDLSLDGRTAPVLGVTRSGAALALPASAVHRSNDQHSYLEWDPAVCDGVRVGDLVRLGVSHPCLTFQLWRAMPVLDDDLFVVSVARTFF